MSACLFCKIVAKELPAKVVYEDDKVIAFKDINPQAPIHYLFIAKNHTRDLDQMLANDEEELVDVFRAISKVSKKENLKEKGGYRVVTNCGEKAGQTVFHTHLHLLAGQQLGSFGI